MATERQTGLPETRTRSRPGKRHRMPIVLLAVAGGCVALALLASPVTRYVINRKLARLPNYVGRVESLQIQVWRAAIVAGDFHLHERGYEKAPPLVAIHYARIRFAWSALVHGRLGATVVVEGADVNAIKRRHVTVDEAVEKTKQKGREVKAVVEPWRDALQHVVPLEISQMEVSQGRFRFRDESEQPAVEVVLEELQITGSGLRTRHDPGSGELPAEVHMQGVLTGGGRLSLTVKADPPAKPPRFEGVMEIKDLSLVAWNPFLRRYADANVSKGTFDFYLEASARDGGYRGYTKPFFRDLKFDNPSTEGKPLKKVARGVANAVASLLKNPEEKKVATKVPFSGTFGSTDVDVWATISNLFRNAFVQALKEGFEGGGGA